MSGTNGPQAETTTTAEERKPPTLADIVREKTDDGRRIIDFFLDVMEDRVEGAELCHRIDAAKQLVKYGSKDAARFIARYRGVPCGHSTRGRRVPADPCSGAEDTPVVATLDASSPLTQDFLTVLSAVDEDLMVRLIRAQTVDGGTIIDFLDDVMQDRNEGFKCHHRIAAAKELIVHIVRDEAPKPEPIKGSVHPEPVEGPVLSTVEGPLISVHPEPGSPELSRRVEGPSSVRAEPPSSVHPEPVLSTVEEPALSLTKEPNEGSGPGRGGPTCPPTGRPAEGACPGTAEEHTSSVHPDVLSTVEGSQQETNNSKPETLPVSRPRRRRTRTQRRREGAARAAKHRKALGSERIEEEKDEKPAPVELTPAERRIKEKLEQHWREPDPYGAPIDSTHPGRSPPW